MSLAGSGESLPREQWAKSKRHGAEKPRPEKPFKKNVETEVSKSAAITGAFGIWGYVSRLYINHINNLKRSVLSMKKIGSLVLCVCLMASMFTCVSFAIEGEPAIVGEYLFAGTRPDVPEDTTVYTFLYAKMTGDTTSVEELGIEAGGRWFPLESDKLALAKEKGAFGIGISDPGHMLGNPSYQATIQLRGASSTVLAAGQEHTIQQDMTQGEEGTPTIVYVDCNRFSAGISGQIAGLNGNPNGYTSGTDIYSVHRSFAGGSLIWMSDAYTALRFRVDGWKNANPNVRYKLSFMVRDNTSKTTVNGEETDTDAVRLTIFGAASENWNTTDTLPSLSDSSIAVVSSDDAPTWTLLEADVTDYVNQRLREGASTITFLIQSASPDDGAKSLQNAHLLVSTTNSGLQGVTLTAVPIEE